MLKFIAMLLFSGSAMAGSTGSLKAELINRSESKDTVVGLDVKLPLILGIEYGTDLNLETLKNEVRYITHSQTLGFKISDFRLSFGVDFTKDVKEPDYDYTWGVVISQKLW